MSNRPFQEILGTLMTTIWGSKCAASSADKHYYESKTTELMSELNQYPEDTLTSDDKKKWEAVERLIQNDEDPMPIQQWVKRIEE